MLIRSVIFPVAVSAILPRRNCVWPIKSRVVRFLSHYFPSHILRCLRSAILTTLEPFCYFWWTRPVLPRRPQYLHFNGITTISCLYHTPLRLQPFGRATHTVFYKNYIITQTITFCFLKNPSSNVDDILHILYETISLTNLTYI